MIDRLLALAGDSDPELRSSKLMAFRRFLLLHGAVRSWLWLEWVPPGDQLGLRISAAVLTVCLGLSFSPRSEVWAPRLALPVLMLQLVWSFPLTDNHFFLELLAVSLLCLVSRGSENDERLVLQALQWLTAGVLFQTGLQKILYGQYFGGEFLSFMIGQGDRFAALFGWILPPGEVARLASYDPLQTGAGPYRAESVLLIAASNLVYLAELTLPALLLARRTRFLAALVAIALVAGIQLGARELGFGLLFANLLLLFPERDWNRRLLPAFAALYLYALAAAWAWLPGGHLLEAGYL